MRDAANPNPHRNLGWFIPCYIPVRVNMGGQVITLAGFPVPVFELVAELAAKRGITEISDLVTIKIDETWTAKTNGHRSEVREGIPPFHMLLEFNGWPFGLIHPFDGTMAQHPNVNEDTLCAALKAAIEAEEAARA